jgi:hypothetical protein
MLYEDTGEFLSETGCQLGETIGSAEAVGGHRLVGFWEDLWERNDKSVIA